MRTHVSPSAGSTVLDKVKVYEGGTGEVNPTLSLAAMGAVPLTALNQPGGIATLNSEGSIQQDAFPLSQMATISIVGPSTVNIKSVTVYTINNYDCFTDYEISSVNGIVVQDGDKLTYIAPDVPGVNGFTVNGRDFPVIVLSPAPVRPTVTAVQSAAAGATVNIALTSTPFGVAGDIATHASTDWQVASNLDFSTILSQSLDNTSNKVSYTFSSITVPGIYYVRARYKDSLGSYSDWSQIVTMVTTPSIPSITFPSNNSTGHNLSISFTSSAFVSPGSISTHASSDWQVASNPTFATIVRSTTNDATNKIGYSVSGLNSNTDYYIRVRYKDATGRTSDWSTATKFTTRTPLAAPVVTLRTNQENNIVAGPSKSIFIGEFSGTATSASADSGLSASISGNSFYLNGDIQTSRNGQVVTITLSNSDSVTYVTMTLGVTGQTFTQGSTSNYNLTVGLTMNAIDRWVLVNSAASIQSVSLASGQLPPGVTLSAGAGFASGDVIMTGTLTQAGSYTFSLNITQSGDYHSPLTIQTSNITINVN